MGATKGIYRRYTRCYAALKVFVLVVAKRTGELQRFGQRLRNLGVNSVLVYVDSLEVLSFSGIFVEDRALGEETVTPEVSTDLDFCEGNVICEVVVEFTVVETRVVDELGACRRALEVIVAHAFNELFELC